MESLVPCPLPPHPAAASLKVGHTSPTVFDLGRVTSSASGMQSGQNTGCVLLVGVTCACVALATLAGSCARATGGVSQAKHQVGLNPGPSLAPAQPHPLGLVNPQPWNQIRLHPWEPSRLWAVCNAA